MKILDWQNNALFLQNWRERMRLPSVVAACILTLIIVILIFTNAHMNKESTHYNYRSRPHSPAVTFPWYKKFFLDLTVFQGIIILFFGTFSAGRMAARERTSGTLDFHRSSPTPRATQVFGILFGSTILEWFLFWGVFALELGLAFIYGLPLIALLKFNFALIVCAILFHSFAILFNITLNSTKSRVIGFPTLIFFYFLVHLVFVGNFSFVYHLTWLPTYDAINTAIKGLPPVTDNSYYYTNFYKNLNNFFGQEWPALVLQLFVQIPLIGLFMTAISRRIASNEKPTLSKAQLLLGYLLILFLMTGSIYSLILERYHSRYFYPTDFLELFFYTVIILSMVASFMATPTQLMYLKALRRGRKLGLKKMNSGDDGASNHLWLGVLCLITIVFYSLQTIICEAPFKVHLLAIIILLSYVVFFASLLEYFLLSQFHKNKILLGALMIILWFLIPSFAFITQSFNYNSPIPRNLLSFSPFFGGIPDIMKSYRDQMDLMPDLVISGGLAVVAVLLALRERIRLRALVNSEKI